jgi:predicted RNase H-like HicB family nuclease
MLTDYIQAAMRQAEFKLLEDGTYFGEIPDCKGVWSNDESLKQCFIELQEVLEEWILLGLKQGHEIPVIDGHDLNLKVEVQEVA